MCVNCIAPHLEYLSFWVITCTLWVTARLKSMRNVDGLLRGFLAAMGLPQRRRRVFIFASLFCNVRDVLLAQGSCTCLGVCREMFGSQRPCFHCFRAFGGAAPVDASEGSAAVDAAMGLDALEPGGPSGGDMGEAEAEAAALCADEPQSYALALDIGEARRVAAPMSCAQLSRRVLGPWSSLT